MRRMYLDTLPAALYCEQGKLCVRDLDLACFGSGVNMVTVDFGADINNELSRRKRDISVR